MISYQEFTENKVALAKPTGVPCETSDVNPLLFPHQRDMVAWAVRGGQRAIFTAFGLGKTFIQLEICRIILQKAELSKGLIIMPLNVRSEFIRDAEKLGITVKFVKSDRDVLEDGIYLTNYESVREGKLDPEQFDVVSCDEASIFRGFGGTKTFREFMATIAGDDRRDRSQRIQRKGVQYRFVATATPSPNEYIELLSYAAFLGIMDVGQAKTRFFKRNSEKADQLTIHPHKEREFWLWVSSWAVFVQKPSDLGHSDEGYELPELDIRWHRVETNHDMAGAEKDGQIRLLNTQSLGVIGSSREKRDSLQTRIDKMLELRLEDIGAHRIIWHDLEDERRAIEASCPGVKSVYGSQKDELKEKIIGDFSNGLIGEIAGKPVMLGSGCNFQRHCNWAIFLGIGFKFNDFIQAVHRLQRFQQTKTVRIDLIYTEAEDSVREKLERSWAQHKELVAQMTAIIKEYGLAESARSEITRSIHVTRREESGDQWKVINNDCVLELDQMEPDSVGLIVTSIPFSNQYEYSPSYLDFGHTDTPEHFWEQMDYLVPLLLRVLQPGRVAAIHVKDRICPGGINGLGFQTIQPFSDETSFAFRKHGFAALSRKTITTDVVRENSQTYRLGWTEQCKDGSRMGNGMPEYLMVFRKPPTDPTNGYADEPVIKDKGEYSRGRWQFDAHGYQKSSGNRLLTVEDLAGMDAKMIFQSFKSHSLGSVYDFEHDVALAERLIELGMLPPSFMLMQPQSNSEEVWTDVTRMLTLNSTQANGGREKHICPLQFDIVDRAITQYSNVGDVVLDPFAGIGTVPLRAKKLGRVGLGVELSPTYFDDSCFHLRKSDQGEEQMMLFDILDDERPDSMVPEMDDPSCMSVDYILDSKGVPSA